MLGFALLLILGSSVAMPARQGFPGNPGEQNTGAAWPELEQGMDKMHVSMRSIKPSGNNDVDFVRLMLPHHQAAIDMAKAELAHGKDPEIHRLAQEVITDQQSEIELMKLWLQRREPSPQK